jgi:5-methyltetrahydrofolate--homocysteine methyltransferase
MSNVFLEWLRSGKVLVADGATGSNLQTRGLAHGLASEQWVLENPDAILRLHRDFAEAGANLLLTSTFGGTALRLEHAGLREQAAEVNRRAAALARQALNGRASLVGGSMGPTGQLLEPLGPLARADAVAAYAGQARALAEGGADVLVIETQFDMGEATAAIEGARATTNLPLVCSFSFDMGAHTMMGLSPAQVARELTALDVDVIGVNCGKSLEENLENLKVMRANTHKPLWMKPNAGLPRMGDDDAAIYDTTPAMMGAAARQWLAAGAQMVGGCCGTTPEHLAAIAGAIARAAQG